MSPKRRGRRRQQSIMANTPPSKRARTTLEQAVVLPLPSAGAEQHIAALQAVHDASSRLMQAERRLQEEHARHARTMAELDAEMDVVREKQRAGKVPVAVARSKPTRVRQPTYLPSTNRFAARAEHDAQLASIVAECSRLRAEYTELARQSIALSPASSPTPSRASDVVRDGFISRVTVAIGAVFGGANGASSSAGERKDKAAEIASFADGES
jgi:hypothetical protein